MNNPIDAFRREDQRVYVEWLDGKPGGAAALGHAHLVLVAPGSKAGRLAAHDPRLVLVKTAEHAALYRVRVGS